MNDLLYESRKMSDAKWFHMLWLADWSSQEIADGYGTSDERVRTLIATVWVANGATP